MADDKGKPLAYSGGQKALHWVVVLLFAGQFPVGAYMVDRGVATNFDAVTNQLYTAHKSFGMLLLLLMLWRVGLRLARGTPAPEPTLTPMQRIASEAVHGLIYVVFIAVAVLGWAGISAYPARGLLFGLEAPAILSPNEGLAKALLFWHGVTARVLLGLVALHVGAALYHRLVLKDGVLRRMLP